MMAEGDPLLGGHVVAAVVEADGGGDVSVVEFEDAVCDEARVESVAERIDTDRGDDEPQDAWFLAAREGEDAECGRAEAGDGDPEDEAKGFHVRIRVILNGRIRAKKAMSYHMLWF